MFTQSLKVGILGYHFSGSSDTNHDSLLSNTTYTGPPRLRYLFQVVQTQTMAAYCRIYLHWTTMIEIFFQVVQTQTTTAYCRILPTLDHHVSDIFQVVQTQTTTAYCRILPTLDHHVSDIFQVVQTQTTCLLY